ncbi:class I SAM-dependent methyltransferase [Novosphingobium sp.]|uniref:class I SAM-dependent methyltransferase n=1 Tax=Novosphingobium sp. TaxID=1874826 RepID=UPI003B52C236
MTQDQNTVIRHQFGDVAADYVSSLVHATGADLARIAEIARLCAPATALDLGAGGGHVTYAMAPHAGQVIATDLSEDMLHAVAAEAARRGLANIVTLTAEAGALPLADASCDMLACRFTLHHWRNPAAGLAEARRVLKPRAPAVFIDVIAPPEPAADTHLQAVELLRDPSHGRDFTVREWQAMLGAAGFAVTAMTMSRLRMDFPTWTARMRTPDLHVAAIRALQGMAGDEVARHFALEPDGSFTIDVMLIEAR